MILQPVLNPFLLLLLFAPVIAAVIWMLTPRGAAGRPRGHVTLWLMRLVLIAACFVMLLRPGIPGGSTQTLATDTDVVLVVDTTASIVAEDWNGTDPRLDGVREDVRAIVEKYPGARFALITFGASADLRMPLTTDTTALIGSLDVLRPEVTSTSRGTSIGIAAPMLADTLTRAAEASPDRSRMVFYFGDGEQTSESLPEPFSASAKYTDAGAVLGYGTAEGGPMRITTGGLDGADAGYIQYQGADALSVIDEKNLMTIADQLGVPFELRMAGVPPTLPEAPSTTVNYAESGEVGNVRELYWIAALVIVALLGVELARATMLVAQLRAARSSPRSLSERSEGNPPPRSLSERSETKRPVGNPPPRSLSERSETKRPAGNPAPRSLSERSETKRPDGNPPPRSLSERSETKRPDGNRVSTRRSAPRSTSEADGGAR